MTSKLTWRLWHRGQRHPALVKAEAGDLIERVRRDAIGVQTVTRNAGKSLLFLDSPDGVSYGDALTEHEARGAARDLFRCEVGHLVAFWQTDAAHYPTLALALACPVIVSESGSGRPARRCWHLLKRWERVK